jgi:acyl dehydratase
MAVECISRSAGTCSSPIHPRLRPFYGFTISGDRNPLHYDLEAAKASRFGEIVVQGGVTSAILNAVVAEKLPGPGTVFLNVNWNFIAAVRPGDAITGRVEVVEARQDKPVTTLRTWVTRGDGRSCWKEPPSVTRWR